MFYLYPSWLHYALFYVIILLRYGGKMETLVRGGYFYCYLLFPAYKM